MKRFLSLLLALFTLLAFAGCTAPGPSGTTPTGTAAPGTTVPGTAVPDSTAPDGAHRRVLIVFFSCTGNTRTAALSLQDKTGADLYELVPAVPYTAADLNYHNDACRANTEMQDPAARPALAQEGPDLALYDIILLGYPLWWGTMPRIVNTFLDTHDLTGKTVLPFCTSGGSGISRSVQDLRQAVPGADIRDGLRIAAPQDSAIDAWLREAGL